jgi:hypothetical protein
MFTDPSGHNWRCGPDGDFCDRDKGNDHDYDPDPFYLSPEDYATARAEYGVWLDMGIDFVNKLREHEGWWTPYLESGDINAVWAFLLTLAYTFEGSSYHLLGDRDWKVFKSYFNDAFINKVGELYTNFGIAGLYVYIGGRSTMSIMRGSTATDQSYVEGTKAYASAWDFKNLGIQNFFDKVATNEIGDIWPLIVSYNGSDQNGTGAWDYGVWPEKCPYDMSKVIWPPLDQFLLQNAPLPYFIRR